MKKSLYYDFSFLLIYFIVVGIIYMKGNVTGLLDGDSGSGGECLFFGVKNALNNGEIPLWFPWIWGGLTGAGTTITQSLYPVNWIIFSILGKHSLKWFMVLNYAAHQISIILGGKYMLMAPEKIITVRLFFARSFIANWRTYCRIQVFTFNIYYWLYTFCSSSFYNVWNLFICIKKTENTLIDYIYT